MALADPAQFSLVEGGPLYRLARAVGAPAGPGGLRRLGTVLAVVTWAPLAVLAAWHGRGADVPFIESLGTHTRFLVVIPVMFVAEAWFDPLCRAALRAMVDSGIVTPSDRPRLLATLDAAMRLRDSWMLEALVALATVALIVAGVRADLPADVSTWRLQSAGATPGLTAAGWWYMLVSLPIFQFLSWRWCVRFLIWWLVLWRIARLDLRLMPTHPDQAGGLGGLGVAQAALCPLSFGASAILVATFAEEILFGGADLRSYVLLLAGIIAGASASLLLPLFFFLPKLLRARQRGLFEYGALATAYTREFDAKWVHGGPPPAEPLLGSADIQSLADLANSVDRVRSMRMVPCTIQQALLFAIAAALPIAPLILIILPLDELLVRTVKSFIAID